MTLTTILLKVFISAISVGLCLAYVMWIWR